VLLSAIKGSTFSTTVLLYKFKKCAVIFAIELGCLLFWSFVNIFGRIKEK